MTRGIVDNNPWREQAPKAPKVKTKRPFTEVELLALLEGTPRGPVGGRVLPDLMRLALLSGCRLEELCALKVEDVADGTISIRQGKTAAATRNVPVHPLLGPILERRSGGSDSYLFAHLSPGGSDKKRSWNISKSFTRYRRSVGVGGTGREVDFHSFRRCFSTALERAGANEPVSVLVYPRGAAPDLEAALEELRSEGQLEFNAAQRSFGGYIAVSARPDVVRQLAQRADVDRVRVNRVIDAH